LQKYILKSFTMPNNKKITCLAVDDEPPALNVIARHIAAIPALELAGTCTNAIDALHMLQQQPIDLLFLDIQMPQILGTDFIRTLKNPPKVIFTTAFRKFAVEGFELNAVDYLLKPISFERFLMAVNKVLQTASTDNLSQVEKKESNTDRFIHVRADRKMQKILLDDILYIESLKDYCRIVSTSKKIITKQAISSIESNLPKDCFVRIHRSYIVALNKIESYSNELIEIAGQQLPIGRMYRHEVEKSLAS
jgi:DNA-binding LytR/AlgR family response regulator